jgi:hypothetical protein
MSLTNITSPSQCIEIFKTLGDEESSDKYQRTLRFSASNYYFEHPQRFSEQQVKEIFSFSLFRKHLPDQQFTQILKKSVDNKSIFPLVLNEWFTGQNTALLDKYIDLLNEKKDYEKLGRFAKHREAKIQTIFLEHKNPPEELIEIALKINPKNILHVENKSFVVDFLNSHNYKILELAKAIDFEPGNNQSILRDSEVKNLIYSRLIDFFIKKNNVDSKELFHSDSTDKEPDFVMFFKKFPIDYIKFFEQKNSDFLFKQFNKDVKVNDNPYSYKTNLAQYIYNEKAKNGLTTDAQYLLNNYYDLVTKPLIENVWGYEATVDPMEFHLRKKNVEFILPFKNMYNEINPQQQQLFLAGAFKAFSIHKDKEGLILDTLNQVPHSIISSYYKNIKGELTSSQQNIMETLISKMKIEEFLPSRDIKSTFKKI